MNRQFRAISFEKFAQRCFSTRKHMLDRRSLETLLEIAQHPVFSNYVHEVAIGPERINIDFLDNDCPDHDPGSWDGKECRECCPLVVRQFIELHWNQNNYEDDDENYPTLVDTLGLALQGFKKLEKVRLDSYADMEDEEGRPRAWGALQYYKLAADLEQAGYKRVHPNPSGVDICTVARDDSYFEPPPHILIYRGCDVKGLYLNYNLVLQALHSIREKKDWTLEMHYDFTPRRWPQYQNQDSLLVLEPLDVSSETWESFRHRVKVLKLAAVFEEGTEYQEWYENWVSELLESCDKVEKLIVADNHWQWEGITGSLRSPSLTSIAIQQSRIYEAELRELLLNHTDSLEELICKDVQLECESPFGWTHVLEHIKALPRLVHVELSQLYQNEAQEFVAAGDEDTVITTMNANSAEEVQEQLDRATRQPLALSDGQFGWGKDGLQD
jgi:hypothetical protein